MRAQSAFTIPANYSVILNPSAVQIMALIVTGQKYPGEYMN